MRRAAVWLLLLAGSAHAGDGSTVSVEVGKTVTRNVGMAAGWFCDDPSLISASIVTRGDVNYWTLIGLKVGTTQCRVGTALGRPSFVFDVTVKAPPPKRP